MHIHVSSLPAIYLYPTSGHTRCSSLTKQKRWLHQDLPIEGGRHNITRPVARYELAAFRYSDLCIHSYNETVLGVAHTDASHRQTIESCEPHQYINLLWKITAAGDPLLYGKGDSGSREYDAEIRFPILGMQASVR